MAGKLHRIVFSPEKKSGEFDGDTTILDAARISGVSLVTDCNGKFRCGKCRVRVVSGTVGPTEADEKFFSDEELKIGWRLGCANKVSADMTVSVPSFADKKKIRVLTKGEGNINSFKPAVRKLYLELEAQTVEGQESDEKLIKDALEGRDRKREFGLNVLRILPEVLRESGYKVTVTLRNNEVIDIEQGNTVDRNFGLAFDIGTTTVVGYLVDLNYGEVLDVASAINGQTDYGSDVITRIQFTDEKEDGLNILNKKITETLEKLCRRLYDSTGITAKNVYETVIVGNTTMNHLLLSIPPRNISRAPFISAYNSARNIRSDLIPVIMNDNGYCYLLPNIGGFVGSDTSGVIIAAEMVRNSDPVIAVDLGTNGEIALNWKNALLAASTACGPVFEGANIDCGMTAVPGAVDSVTVKNGKLEYTTIGGNPLKGICGSGLIDLIAVLLKYGVIDETGRFAKKEDISISGNILASQIVFNKNNIFFIIDTNNPNVYISQRDLREFQLAKAAIRTGIELLLNEMNITADDLECFCIAGAFGNYINVENAICIGMFPDMDVNIIKSIGNGAGFGALKALLSIEERAAIEETAAAVRHVELSVKGEFQEKFAEFLLFPVTGNCNVLNG